MRQQLEVQAGIGVSVFERFRAFWTEVETLRESVVSRAAAPVAAEGSTALVHPPTAVREQLLAVVRSQEAELTRQGKSAALEYYRQAQYAMVAAADELFIRMPWSGASYWSSHLLETACFGTRRAGDAVFARIERLIQQPHPAEKELAAVYLTTLALGFRGKYGDGDDDGTIDRYKRQLYEVIFEKQPDLTDTFHRLLPQCYENTIAAGSGRRLRSPRVWWWASAAVVAIWIVVSHMLWLEITTPLYQKIATIRDRTAQFERLKQP